MKEFQLFKEDTSFEGRGASLRFSSGVDEEKILFHEIDRGNLRYEIEIIPGKASKLEVVLFQNAPLHEPVWLQIQANIPESALLKLTVIQHGAESSRVDLSSRMLGSHSRLELRGLQNAQNSQRFSMTADAVHTIPHSSSDLQIWCAARDESRTIFNGGVRIEEGAHHTDAFQKNRNLILSKRAVIDSFPKLFISNDNVKCAHGSSTSTIEPEQAYYLQSRGIELAVAEGMLVQGFLRQSLADIGSPEIRREVYQKLGVQDEEWL